MLDFLALALPQLFWVALMGAAVAIVLDAFMPWGGKK